MIKGNRDTWVAIFSTLFILFIFQFGAYITVPGVVMPSLPDNTNSLSQLLNMLGGGGLKKMSLFSVGISPYITSQIIIQMLSNDVIKHLSELRKGGERGRLRMEFYTRMLTFPFAIMSALGTISLMSTGLIQFQDFSGKTHNSFGDLPVGERILLVFLFVAGTYISLFLADIISKRGLGNGVTILIMSGIAASLPENFVQTYKFLSEDKTVLQDYKTFIAIFKFIIYLFFYFLILLMIVFINGSVRKIPIQQTGQGLILDKNKLSYLPIKLMPAGIIPVVFSGSLMVFPSAIGELMKNSNPSVMQFTKNYLSLTSGTGLFIYAVLIILFSFLYSHIQINVEEITRNFGKSGRFIPGIRSGQQTYNHIKSVINRINCFGAPFLSIIAVLPNFLNLFAGLPSSMSLGGTGIIILVSGAIQIMDSIRSNTITSKYKAKNNLLKSQINRNLSLKEPESETKQFYLW